MNKPSEALGCVIFKSIRTENVTTGNILPEGVERLFLEIISNAGDNADRANRAGLSPGTIDVIMDKKTISIRNGGPPIPVEMHPKDRVRGFRI